LYYTKPGDDSAGLELNGARFIPLLEFAYRVLSIHSRAGSNNVDIDVCPFLGSLAMRLDLLRNFRAIRSLASECRTFNIIILRILWRYGPNKIEADLQLSIKKVEDGFLEDMSASLVF